MKLSSAIDAVNKNGALLVFAIKNKREPKSLWHHFFPRSEMRWEWDEKGDQRVSDLWFLREKLSSSFEVVYCKWYQNRATLISKELYPAVLKSLNPYIDNSKSSDNFLSTEAKNIFNILKDDSPLSTKQLKELSGLSGKIFESEYHRLMKELWDRLFIVGVGEVDDGAFPSLAIGAASLYFEEEWRIAASLKEDEALQICKNKLGEESAFFRYLVLRRKNNLKTVEHGNKKASHYF